MYRLKHIPSGQYFKPSRYGSRSNLSTKGKIYHTKPSLNWVSSICIYIDNVKTIVKTNPEDWIIEEIGQKSDQSWEPIPGEIDRVESHRLKVPGGWIIRTIAMPMIQNLQAESSSCSVASAVSQIFIADSGHSWKL
jgi:hypothetical protein